MIRLRKSISEKKKKEILPHRAHNHPVMIKTIVCRCPLCLFNYQEVGDKNIYASSQRNRTVRALKVSSSYLRAGQCPGCPANWQVTSKVRNVHMKSCQKLWKINLTLRKHRYTRCAGLTHSSAFKGSLSYILSHILPFYSWNRLSFVCQNQFFFTWPFPISPYPLEFSSKDFNI